MAKIVKVPVLGQSVEEVRILQWFKNEGDAIAVGERLAEIETDKTNIDFESPEAGIVRRILVAADSYVPVETPVAIVGTADEPIEGLVDGAAPAAPVSASGIAVSPRARRTAETHQVDLAGLAGRGTGPEGRILERDVLSALPAPPPASADRAPRSSPLARAVASGAGLDLAGVAGSGPGGRIVADDVRAASAPEAPASGVRTLALAGLRKRVADNLMRSVREKPHVTLEMAVEMTEAMRLRQTLLPAVEKATGVRLSPTDLIVKACAVALREHPFVNAHIDAETITLFDEVHIGLAVSLGDGGLIVPVIREVHRKGLAQLARDRSDLAARARDGALTSAEVSGGTFTVTNLGNYGVSHFNPIIPPPQAAILGIGAIADTVVARDGAPAVRPMMGLSLSFDHRALDGAPAAAFLARVREILEQPYLLLL